MAMAMAMAEWNRKSKMNERNWVDYTDKTVSKFRAREAWAAHVGF
jgi:hypothetical protein